MVIFTINVINIYNEDEFDRSRLDMLLVINNHGEFILKTADGASIRNSNDNRKKLQGDSFVLRSN